MMDDLPVFMTIEQAAKVLQLGRSKTYELSVEWEQSGGKSGLPFVWFGHQKAHPESGSRGLHQPVPLDPRRLTGHRSGSR